MSKILIIDDEAPIRQVMGASLKDEGYEVITAANGEEGLKALRSEQPTLCFLDIWMPGALDGIQVLTQAKLEGLKTEFIMISGHGTIETAVKATKLGAWDFIEKPLSMDKMFIVISNLLSFLQQKDEKSALLNKLRKNIAFIGESAPMVQTKQMISRVAPTSSWILISGESGTGKRLAAENIHYMSPRAHKAFVEVNCLSVADDLLESEIFGLEKGAWPGVDRTQRGKIELAESGTLYIEEISGMNMIVQAKLLRYLQEQSFQRVGGTDFVKAEVRIIASTTKDLEVEVREGRFREDFYHRLNISPFRISALRERPEDIPALAQHFGEITTRESGEIRKVFSEKAMEVMRAYLWPRNVRELKNFIERVYILTPSEYIDVHDLKFAGMVEPTSADSAMTTVITDDMSNFREARAQFEKEYLIKKITENSGNISRTAEVIGLERSYLHRKIKAYGIEVNT
ncbi:MAG: sigma-54-dependent Fis family transcriptional regulator [Bdellovibrionales bacterium]|nr:sigma-54-dependent Fis family transcriptional regulator [Bdellovibrionales bacterium]